MHGEIKLGRWLPFQSEQVIRRDGHFLWAATVNPLGIPLFRGFDRLVDGAGEMRCNLFGLVPFIKASGPDITRSAIGRLQAEAIWLPSLFCDDNVPWTSSDWSHATTMMTSAGITGPVEFSIDPSGRVMTVRLGRWGNPPPDTKHFRMVDFGGIVEDEQTFAGYTIPSRVRGGWYFGSPQFDSIGEFFRATIDDATFR